MSGKSVYILKVDESEGYGSAFRILGVFSSLELAKEHLRKFRQQPEYAHRSDDYWVDEHELDVLE